LPSMAAIVRPLNPLAGLSIVLLLADGSKHFPC
jgi:hypothetical protein